MILVLSGSIRERSIPLRFGIWMSQNSRSTGLS
ncbi:unknown [Alistipes sp. CAG:435]|nr:unknown [Alistipes sp. CAG:435]